MFDSGNDVDIASGYILSVNSSENDYDHRKNLLKLFGTFYEAKNYIECVQVFAEHFGNHYGSYSDKADTFPVEKLTQDNLNFLAIEYDAESLKSFAETTGTVRLAILDTIRDLLSEMCYDVLGSSECYACRVLDSWYIYEVTKPITSKVVLRS